jgi:hypothetical protein
VRALQCISPVSGAKRIGFMKLLFAEREDINPMFVPCCSQLDSSLYEG